LNLKLTGLQHAGKGWLHGQKTTVKNPENPFGNLVKETPAGKLPPGTAQAITVSSSSLSRRILTASAMRCVVPHSLLVVVKVFSVKRVAKEPDPGLGLVVPMNNLAWSTFKLSFKLIVTRRRPLFKISNFAVPTGVGQTLIRSCAVKDDTQLGVVLSLSVSFCAHTQAKQRSEKKRAIRQKNFIR
jgi:hypothetical protein